MMSKGVFDETILGTCNLLEDLSISVESKVFLLEDPDTKEKYTLKQIKNYRQFFTEETLDIVKNISHESIAKIEDLLIVDDDLYIIKKYIEGTTLDRLFMQKEIILESDLYYIMIKIGKILKYLHSYNRLIHRDIKPSNLVFTPEGNLILIDLMSIRQVKENQSSDTVYIGSSDYAAPEQFGYSQTDERTDIYNLGASIKSLFKDYTSSASLQVIIDRCLSFNPDDRYQTVDELLQVLERKNPKEEKNSYKKLISLGKYIVFASLIVLCLYTFTLKRAYDQLNEDYSILSARSELINNQDVYYRGLLIRPDDWVHIVGQGDDPLYEETEETLGLSRRISAYGPYYANDMKWLEMTADVYIYSTYNPYDSLPLEIQTLIDRKTFNGMASGESVKLDYYSDNKKHLKILIVNPEV